SVEWFVNAIDGLARFYRFMSLDDLRAYFRGERRFNNCCHVTFDDGHATFYEHALPVLRSRGIPATLFVSPVVIRDESTYWFQDLGWLLQQVDDRAIRGAVAHHLNCAAADLERFQLFSVFATLDIESIRTVLASVFADHRIGPMPPPNVTLGQLREVA